METQSCILTKISQTWYLSPARQRCLWRKIVEQFQIWRNNCKFVENLCCCGKDLNFRWRNIQWTILPVEKNYKHMQSASMHGGYQQDRNTTPTLDDWAHWWGSLTSDFLDWPSDILVFSEQHLVTFGSLWGWSPTWENHPSMHACTHQEESFSSSD